MAVNSIITDAPQRPSCVSYFEEYKKQKNIDFLIQILVSELLSRENIRSFSHVDLKVIIFTVARNINMPQEASQKVILFTNITNIYQKLLKENTIEPHERQLMQNIFTHSDYLAMYQNSRRSFLPGQNIMGTDTITTKMKISFPEELLGKDQIQGLFNTLEFSSSVTIASDRQVNVQAFVLCYKAFFSTEEFLDSIYISFKYLQDNSDIQHRLILLLEQWFFHRYYIKDLCNEIIKKKFEKIINFLEKSPFNSIREGNTKLKAYFQKALNLTPRRMKQLSPENESFRAVSKLVERMTEKWHKEDCEFFANEIQYYFLPYLKAVPIEEFFMNLEKIDIKIPHIYLFIEATKKFEAWLLHVFKTVDMNDHKKETLTAFLLETMNYARDKYDFQAFYTLFSVLHKSKFLHENSVIKTNKKKKNLIEQFQEHENYILHQLKQDYSKLDSHKIPYFPAMVHMTHDLSAITSRSPVVEKNRDDSRTDKNEKNPNDFMYDTERFRILYKCLKRILPIRDRRVGVEPKSDLHAILWPEFSQAASSSSSVPGDRAWK